MLTNSSEPLMPLSHIFVSTSTCGPGFESLCLRLDGLELGFEPTRRTQLGQELCGQSNNRGQRERFVLQAADVLQHGPLQVEHLQFSIHTAKTTLS